jgi:hypothetical protein
MAANQLPYSQEYNQKGGSITTQVAPSPLGPELRGGPSAALQTEAALPTLETVSLSATFYQLDKFILPLVFLNLITTEM